MALAVEHFHLLLDAQSMGANFNSDPVKLKNYKGYSLQLVATGTPNGSYKLQASNDPDINNISNWADITNSTQPITTSGITFYNVTDAYYMFVRLVYTRSSGTGTVTARVLLKD